MRYTSIFYALTFCLFTAVSKSNASHAETVTLLSCLSKSDYEIYVELNKPSDFGAPLHCVTAPFIHDLTSCSPNTGWGLSRGTGLTELVEITTNWKYAHSHPDGKFRAGLSPTHFAAAASFGEGLPNTTSLDQNTFWLMHIDRITGKGWIAASNNEGPQEDEQKILIECFPTARRF